MFLGNDGEIAVDDRDVARIFNDLLESWIRGSKFIMKKEELGPEMVEKQSDFFQKSSEMEDLPILILSNQLELEAGKRICRDASTALDTWLRYAKRYFNMRPNGTDSEHFGFLMFRCQNWVRFEL